MKKKICLIDFDMSVRGGVEQVTVGLSAALTNHYDVHLLSLCQKGEQAYSLDPRVKYKALLKDERRLRQMRADCKPLLSDYFRENQIEVAIIQGNYPGFVVSAVRSTVGTKLIFCDHGALMNQWKQKDIRLIRWISAMLCHRVVTLTEQSRMDYLKKFHLRSRKVRCIYNWIDLSVPRSERYNTESKRIVCAGRFGKEKGFDMLVKAFAPVARKHPDWSLDLFGDGEMMPVVRRLVKENHLEEQVNLLGMRTDLAECYKNYAMYVLPSYREGMPLVLLEAKANRLPIVSFDIMTGPREIVRDGIDGILIQPYDLEAMGEAMCRLIDHPELRLEMSARSQENLEQFSQEKILEQWRQLIEE